MNPQDPINNPAHQSHAYAPYPETDNLGVISTLFLVKGILTFFVALFFVAYAVFGSYMTQVDMHQGDPMAFHPAWIFVIIGIVGFLICIVVGVLSIMAANYIKKRKHYNFVFVMAIINCMSGVLGIILGIFTLIDLNKRHVKAQFNSNTTAVD